MNYSKATQKTCNNTGITQDVQIFKIIPPFRKEDVSSHESLSNAYKVCVQEILAQFPDAMAEKITISRTFTETKKKELHSLTIIAPPESTQFVTSIKADGIPIMGKTIFPLGYVPNKNRLLNFYPRKVRIKINNLPAICSDAEAKTLMRMPENLSHKPQIDREYMELTRGKKICNGSASLEVILNNEEEEQCLRTWSYKRRTSEKLTWNGVEISSHAPALHHCNFCENLGVQFKGHHDDWCFKKQNSINATEKSETDAISIEKSSHSSLATGVEEEKDVQTESEGEIEDNCVSTLAEGSTICSETNPFETESSMAKAVDEAMSDSSDTHPNLLIDESTEKNESLCMTPRKRPKLHSECDNKENVNKVKSQKVQQKSSVKQNNGRDMSPYNYSVLQRHSKNAVRKATKACSIINWPPPDRDNPVQS